MARPFNMEREARKVIEFYEHLNIYFGSEKAREFTTAFFHGGYSE